MALGADTAKVVTSVPVPTKAWLEKEAARRGLRTATYIRSVLVQMHERALAQ